uniref:Uncharacterized protein n=1 Tax=Strigamia maritima TaxID=126957 RepID=T1J883_STRMM
MQNANARRESSRTRSLSFPKVSSSEAAVGELRRIGALVCGISALKYCVRHSRQVILTKPLDFEYTWSWIRLPEQDTVTRTFLRTGRLSIACFVCSCL